MKTRKVPYKCRDCGAMVPGAPAGSFTLGYARDGSGHTICYQCAGQRELRHMDRTGRITLYLTKGEDGRYKLQNWPGSVVWTGLSVRIGRHNMAGRAYHIWFIHGGHVWHGVQYGDWTELCHCKRTARTA